MRKLIFSTIGVLEVAIALTLVVLGFQLPNSEEISTTFGRVEQVTDGSEKQVRLMRHQVADLRRQDLPSRAKDLRVHTKAAVDSADRSQINFETVLAIAQSLADTSRGLSTWAQAIDPNRLKEVSKGLGETATYLETSVAEPSARSAAELETSLAALEKDSADLAKLLRQAPPDLKAARDIHDGLASFDTGLEKLGELVQAEKITAMKEGMSGLETSLTSTAEQVDKLSGISYPVVTLAGLKPNIENRPFWPDGEKVADGLRKATRGVQAANKQLTTLEKNLPDLERSILESRKSVGQTRASLQAALLKQDELETLLKSVPEQTAALAEALPKIGRTFTTILKETRKLRDLAVALKAAQSTLDQTLRTWPDAAKGIQQSAMVLDRARTQLDATVANRAEYERAVQGSTQAARSLADLLPAFTDQLDSRLGQQENSLEQMEYGLAEVNKSIPVLEEKTSNLMKTVRWLLYLMGSLLIVHAAWVLAEALAPTRTLHGGTA